MGESELVLYLASDTYQHHLFKITKQQTYKEKRGCETKYNLYPPPLGRSIIIPPWAWHPSTVVLARY